MSAPNGVVVPGQTANEVEVLAKATRRRFSGEYKLKILREAEACTQPGEFGALLRREGLYSTNLTTWRAQRERGELLGAIDKTGRGLGRVDSDGYIGPPARLGSGALSVTDPIGPPPTIITARGNQAKVTPDRSGRSREPEDGVLVWLVGRTYFRQERAGRSLTGQPGSTEYCADPRLDKTVPDGGDPALAGGKEPCLHWGAGGRTIIRRIGAVQSGRRWRGRAEWTP